MSPRAIVALLAKVLLISPQGNWGPSPLREEARAIVNDAPWYKVYDIAEALYGEFTRLNEIESYDDPPALWFERELNAFFVERGIGWRMIDGAIEMREPEGVAESSVAAIALMRETLRTTAATELAEARRDLSRRPEADLTGAIQHAGAALECLARDITGDAKSTLGEILRDHPALLPTPLKEAAQKLWGYASEYGRHVREGRSPTLSEAFLVVGIVSALAASLVESSRPTA
jgi:hypothetical protein